MKCLKVVKVILVVNQHICKGHKHFSPLQYSYSYRNISFFFCYILVQTASEILCIYIRI